ncbi:hypothetical protein MIND_00571800 [Mycena indigotica]|uniref:Uncharacterized protein n=1 Tax=Mycena indigotica TaxID=2126181 RepID=A0A8H6SS77_9AGAR|nr:uncharacterized protein MIND_00571800 [Mycena indigotica]KAF7303432.1 hypothetical protein MIND_00571800 [Mycena indigotica]
MSSLVAASIAPMAPSPSNTEPMAIGVDTNAPLIDSSHPKTCPAIFALAGATVAFFFLASWLCGYVWILRRRTRALSLAPLLPTALNNDCVPQFSGNHCQSVASQLLPSRRSTFAWEHQARIDNAQLAVGERYTLLVPRRPTLARLDDPTGRRCRSRVGRRRRRRIRLGVATTAGGH